MASALAAGAHGGRMVQPRGATQGAPVRSKPGARLTGTCRASSGDREAWRAPSVAVSLFLPFKHLPPDGQVIAPAEAACDPLVQNCKTQAYVFETACSSCDGTGHARSWGSSRAARGGRGGGRRASLHVCLACHGMGHVRRTTTRLVELPDGAAEQTMARTQRLPGEPTQQQAAPAQQPRDPQHQHRHGKGLLQKALELGEQLSKAQHQQATSASPPSSSSSATNGAAVPGGPATAGASQSSQGQASPPVGQRAPAPTQPQQNNIVSSPGLAKTKQQQQQQAGSGTAKV